MRALKIANQEWKYRGEGNANLVITLPEVHQILRIMKVPLSECGDRPALLAHLRRSTEYINTLLVPIFGADYSLTGEIVEIGVEDMKTMSDSLKIVRPVSRANKGVPLCDWLAVLQSDLCYLPSYLSRHHRCHRNSLAVEIKPKCGFLPNPDSVPQQFWLKTNVYKYHMTQLQKFQTGKVNTISQYCPADLFSGCYQKMNRALRCLLRVPQNNFRIFQNGSLVYGGECPDENVLKSVLADFFNTDSDLSKLCENLRHMLIEGLRRGRHRVEALGSVRNLETGNGESGSVEQLQACLHRGCAQHSTHVCESRCGLPSSCVLSRILQVQRLDNLDAEGVEPLYQQLLRHYQHNIDRLESLLYRSWSEEELSSVEKNLSYPLKKVQEFLMAATCKDCSVLVVMQACHTECDDVECLHPVQQDLIGQPYMTSTHVVDLDPKPHHRITQYQHEDRDLIHKYQSTQAQVALGNQTSNNLDIPHPIALHILSGDHMEI